jgi:hypothetical protein
MKTFPSNRRPQARAARGRLGHRVALLLLCLGIGAVIGFAGRHLTASDAWFLAIPLCVVVGWLVVADPITCTAAAPARSDDRPAP